MKVLHKWNYIIKDYDEVLLPKLNYKTYSVNMEEIVNCPQCLKEFPFGKGYTSLEFHTKFGMGYAVCHKCYQKEMAKRYIGDDK